MLRQTASQLRKLRNFHSPCASCSARLQSKWTPGHEVGGSFRSVRNDDRHVSSLSSVSRNLSSKPPKSPTVPPPIDDEESEFDEDDEFTSILALDPEEAERAAAAALAPKDVVRELSGAPHDMTPEQADALVRSMVAAAARSAAPGAAALSAPPLLTAETVNMLLYARIETNHISAVGGERRIERKAVGRLDLKALGLSRLASAAVEEIAGPRCRDGVLRIVGDRYQSSEENVAWVASQLARVVREAKIAVGEDVDDVGLESWDDVLAAARNAPSGDSEEVREMVEIMAASSPAS